MKNISDILIKRAREFPNKIAFTIFGKDEKIDNITFGELEERVESFSRYLYEQTDIEKSYMLLYNQNIEVIVAFLACIRIGVTTIPMEMPEENKEILKWENVVENSQTAYIITNKCKTKFLEQICKKSEKLKNINVLCENKGNLKYVKKKNNVAILQYTSGSTGNPKGVIITNNSLLDNMDKIKKKFEFNKESRMVTWLPYYHDLGLILGILEGIYVGYRVILMDPKTFMKNPQIWIRAISDYKGTHIVAPNFAYTIMKNMLNKMDNVQKKSCSFRSVKKAICGGEPVDLNTMLCFLKTAKTVGFRENVLSPAYGLAEATLVISSYQIGQKVNWLKVDRKEFENHHIVIKDRGYLNGDMDITDQSCSDSMYVIGNGFAIEEHNISIRTENGEKVKQLEVGEICFSGDSLADGYWEKVELNKQLFGYDIDGTKYLKTGDLGFVDENGELYIAGRIKDLIIIRGTNYYPQDLERISFNSSPSFKVDGTAAFSINEKLVIVQEICQEYEMNGYYSELADDIRMNILKTCNIEVEEIVFVKEGSVPKTGSGKIQRQRAKKLFLKKLLPSVLEIYGSKIKKETNKTIKNYQDLKNNIERIVLAQLNIRNDKINETMTFNEMGISSMISLVVIEKLEKLLNRIISPVTIYNYNTINDLTNYLWSLIEGDIEEDSVVEEDCDVEEEYTSDELIKLLEKEIGGLENV